MGSFCRSADVFSSASLLRLLCRRMYSCLKACFSGDFLSMCVEKCDLPLNSMIIGYTVNEYAFER